MKRWFCLAIAGLMLLSLAGCSSGVPQEDYDQLQADFKVLQDKYVSLEKKFNDMQDKKETQNTDVPDSNEEEVPEPPKGEEKADSIQDYTFTDSFFTYSGTGDDVVTGLTVEYYSFLKVTHLGDKHFAIKAHYDDTYDLLVNTTDPYDGGCTLLYPNKEYTLEVIASGSWNVEAFRIGTSSTDSFSGTGDVITPICRSTSNVYEIIADGDEHFAVKGYHEDGSYDLLVNTTDPYSGKVMFNGKDELCFFEITGTREFTIKPVIN